MDKLYASMIEVVGDCEIHSTTLGIFNDEKGAVEHVELLLEKWSKKYNGHTAPRIYVKEIIVGHGATLEESLELAGLY